MKHKTTFIIVLLIGMILFGMNSLGVAYNHQTVDSYLSYRIKYIHNIAYNTKANVSKKRAKE